MIYKFLFAYLILINMIVVYITIYDKMAAIRHKRRIRESTLLMVSVFGGSVFMLLTMLLIRHKTRHHKFMYGIPLIIIIELILIALFVNML